MASSSSAAAAAAASSASSSTKKITLESCDKILLEISENVAVQSLKVKKILEDLGDNHGDKIPVPNVTGSTLGKIVEYCNKYHADLALDGIPPRQVNSRTLKPWEKEFVDVDLNTLFDLIYAANYLDIKSLVDLTCQAVANMMIGKTTEEMREMFHIKNDFTPEEEEQVRRECQWLFGHQN